MTTAYFENINNQNKFNIKQLIILGLIIVLMFSLFQFYNILNTPSMEIIDNSYYFEYYGELTPAQIRIIEVVSKHAYIKHSLEVSAGFDCLKKNGSVKSFRTSGMTNDDGSKIPSMTWLCFDGGNWYAVITTYFQKIGSNKVARLFTAYEVSKNFYPSIDDYIEYLSNNWSATLSNYIFNPGYFQVIDKFKK